MSEQGSSDRGRCLICGKGLNEVWAAAHDIEYAAVPESFDYLLCDNCDALSIAPLPSDRLSEIYPSTYYSFTSAGKPMERGLATRVKKLLDRHAFEKVLKGIAASRVRMLDVGGGDGVIAERLARSVDRSVEVTVCDIDEESVHAAIERGMSGHAGRFETLPEDTEYDLILMLNLIEHVANPVEVLEKARRVLAPGGVIWLQTPNFRSLDARLFRSKSWAGLHCPRHWVIFSPDALHRAMARAELEVTSLRRTQAGSFWAASLLGLKPGRATLERPLVQHPGYMPLAAAGAALDFATMPFRQTSQQVALATHSERVGG